MSEDEIIEAAGCTIIYRSSDWGPAVPYRSEHRPETPDRPNRGFIDLRDRSDAGDAVYEAADVPGLRALITAVNAAGSQYMSLGCERKLNSLEPPQGEATCYLNSYIEVAARDPLQQHEAAMLALARELARRAHLELHDWVQLELGIERLKHFFGREGGHCLHIAVSGFGRNAEEALLTHTRAGERLANAFACLTAENAASRTGEA